MVVPAQAATSETAERRVVLRVLGSEQALALTKSTSVELFERLGVRVDVASISEDLPGSGEPPLAIATIEITPPLCRIVIIDGSSGAELDRRTFSESSVETAVEAAAHIAYFVVETLLAPPESEPDTPEPAAPPPAPVTEAQPTAPPVAAVVDDAAPEDASEKPLPSERGSVGIDLGLAFSAISLGSGRVRPGTGLTAEIRFPSLGVPLGVLVAATTHAASELEFQDASAELRPSVLRLLATLDTPLGSALALSFALGGGVEWLRLTPTSVPPDVDVADTQSIFEPLATGLAGLRIKLGDRAFLSALGGIDVSLNPTTFKAQTESGEEELLHMPDVRPVILIGAAASLDASPRFSSPEAR